MMHASDFEFRNRWWLFGVIFGVAFALFTFDHVPVGARIADRLVSFAAWPEPLALRVVFGTAALIMIAAALVRVWGQHILAAT